MSRQLNSKNLVLFACTFFSSLLLLSFDAYCKAEILTDIVFFNIAGIQFHRIEFVSIIFSVALLIGIFLEKTLKHNKFVAALSVSVLAIFCAVFALLNTDLLQLLCPTMRISHVTMSLSRILGIVAGVSGGFVGYGISFADYKKLNRNAILISVISAVIISIYMQSSGLYRISYLFTAVLLLICAFIFGIKNNANSNEDITVQKIASKHIFIQGFFLTVMTVAVLITPRFIMISCGLSEITASLTVALLLLVCIFVSEIQNTHLFGISGILTGSIIHYIIIHYLCVKTVYSGNRVIYSVNPLLFLSILIILTISIILVRKTRKTV